MKLLDLMRRVSEGMDNATFLSKDLSSGPTTYPVPPGSREYEDIDSKRRGGKKIKVKARNGNKNTRNPKAKHAG